MGLTESENLVVDLLGAAYTVLRDRVVGKGPTRDADLAELASRIHAVQRAVIAQAACRERPDLYRGLGEEIALGRK
jgi:hypothetical protein